MVKLYVTGSESFHTKGWLVGKAATTHRQALSSRHLMGSNSAHAETQNNDADGSNLGPIMAKIVFCPLGYSYATKLS